MHQILKTEAIVLRSIKYSETSKIVTFYTHELGRVGAIVKGVRKKESKLGSVLEPMSYVSLVLYVKESREVQTVAQCDLIKSFFSLSADLDRVSVGFSLLEIVSSISHEQEQNIPLFTLLRDSLMSLTAQQTVPDHLLFYFELKLAELLGFLPVFDTCERCKTPIEELPADSAVSYNILKGVPVCERCSGYQSGLFRITSNAMKVLRTVSTFRNPQELHTVKLEVSQREELDLFLNKFLQAHVSGFRIPRSRSIYKGGK